MNNKHVINRILLTRDGRQIGNAIITAKNGNIFEITTDYGNKANMTATELDSLFLMGRKDITHKHAVK